MKPILLCLHGWGASKDSFTELRSALQDAEMEILTPDLPGFGEQPEPGHAYTNDDYAEWVIQWLTSQVQDINEQEWYLLGHSAGGRIAIKLVTGTLEKKGLKQPKHLFLCAAAGIRHPRHFKRIIGLTLAKTGKFFLSIPGLNLLQPIGKKLLYKLIRVHDYEKATPIMRQTLINLTQEDLRPLLQHIALPTDLFWGTADGMTPYSDAKIMEAEIRGSTLHTFEGVHHRVHRDRAKEIAMELRKTTPQN